MAFCSHSYTKIAKTLKKIRKIANYFGIIIIFAFV